MTTITTRAGKGSPLTNNEVDANFTNLSNDNQPDVRPSLLLDFANSKTLDPRITFTRGSTATYWDGKTTTKAQENLITYSQDIVAGNWNITQLGVVDNQTAPDGTSTAQLFTPNTNQNYHYVYTGNSPVTTAPNTLSVYAKNNGANYVFLRSNSSNAYCGVNFDLSNSASAAVEGSGNIDSYSATDVGNGWYRLTVTFNKTLASQTQILLNGNNTNAAEVWTGNGTDGIYVWGAQLENGSSATAYTATTSSPIVKYQPTLQTAGTDEARFDHDPVTGESKGLLIEEARTNLQFPSTLDSTWGKVGQMHDTATDNYAIAPDGTYTAGLIYEAVSATQQLVSKASSSVVSGSTYVWSVFVKPYTWGGDVEIHAYGDGSTSFDLSGSDFTASDGSKGMYSVGNGWKRVWWKNTKSNTTGTFYLGFSGSSYAGDGYAKAFLAWGFQLEQGSFPTSYIPTSGSTVTRATEETQIQGSNFTDWYNFDEGTLYYEASVADVSELSENNISDGTNNNRILWALRSSAARAPYLQRYNSAVGEVYNNTGLADGVASALAIALKDGDIASSLDGGTVATSTADIPKDVDRLQLGMLAVGDSKNVQHIKKFAYYPKRLSDATLQAMTEE